MGGKSGPSGTTTSTQNTAPWGEQQPYLTDIFQQAGQLYHAVQPQYYPQATYAGPTDAQSQALSGIQSMPGSSVSSAGMNADQALMGGQYLFGNPSLQMFGSQANSNLGTNNAGTSTLLNQAAGGASNPTANNILSYFSNNSPINNASGFANLANIAGNNQALSGPTGYVLNNLSGVNQGTSAPGAGTLNQLSWNNPGYNVGSNSLENFADSNPNTANPANSAFAQYASGSNLASGNPNTSALAQSVMAQVLPGIQSQFINGGALNSPEAARASAAGVTSALAPLMFQQYQQEEQNQLTGAQGLSNSFLQGAGLQAGAAQNLSGNILQGAGLQGQFAQNQVGNAIAGAGLQSSAAQNQQQNYLQGAGLQTQSANDLLSSILAGYGQQIGAAGTLGSQQLQGGNLQQTAASTLGSQALQGLGLNTQATTGLQSAYGQGVNSIMQGLALAPQTQGLPYTDLSQLYSAGAADQSNQQAAINDAVQRWNYNQTLPWQSLNQYIGQVTGNYGGTTQLNQPYFAPSGVQQAASTIGSIGAGIGGLSTAASGVSALIPLLASL